MGGETSHSKGDDGRPNIVNVEETDPSVSAKRCAPARFGSNRTKCSTARVLSRCRVSISSGRVFCHVIQRWQDLDFWNELPVGAGCLSTLGFFCMFTCCLLLLWDPQLATYTEENEHINSVNIWEMDKVPPEISLTTHTHTHYRGHRRRSYAS